MNKVAEGIKKYREKVSPNTKKIVIQNKVMDFTVWNGVKFGLGLFLGVFSGYGMMMFIQFIVSFIIYKGLI